MFGSKRVTHSPSIAGSRHAAWALGHFDERWIAGYPRSKSLRRSWRIETRRIELSALCQLRFLRDEAVCSHAVVDTSPVAKVVVDFGRYLHHEQGLACTAIYGFTQTTRQPTSGNPYHLESVGIGYH